MSNVFVDQFGDRVLPTRRRYAFGIGSRKRPCRLIMFGSGDLHIRFDDVDQWQPVDEMEGDFTRVDVYNRELFLNKQNELATA